MGGPAPPVAEGVAVAKRVAPKPAAQKKVTAKPKPEEIIEISPDKEVQKEKPVNKKKEGGANSKKKSHTLTSVLTARSKVEGEKRICV